MDGREAESTFRMVKRRFAPWRLYSSAECASLIESKTLAVKDVERRGRGSGSTRPDTNSARESTRPRVNSASYFSYYRRGIL